MEPTKQKKKKIQHVYHVCMYKIFLRYNITLSVLIKSDNRMTHREAVSLQSSSGKHHEFFWIFTFDIFLRAVFTFTCDIAIFRGWINIISYQK